ncbi:uncharacterized protein METZ01_LOCUS269954 [marine metagenome]|uniref:Uncharacterized protein n=1 Tax=marine metagenome TaxID=408172 RepID=A0A382JY94_9ZZZZ
MSVALIYDKHTRSNTPGRRKDSAELSARQNNI